jgi:predicted transposase YdaD
VNWRVTTAVNSAVEFEEQELMATLSQAYLEWEQKTLQRGRQEGRQEGEVSLVLRLLSHKLGDLPSPVVTSVESLALSKLEGLGEALLGFDSLADLNNWLDANLDNAKKD